MCMYTVCMCMCRCGRLTVARLRELYSVAASDGSPRVPSYTDRVLLHSLTPDLQAAQHAESPALQR